MWTGDEGLAASEVRAGEAAGDATVAGVELVGLAAGTVEASEVAGDAAVATEGTCDDVSGRTGEWQVTADACVAADGFGTRYIIWMSAENLSCSSRRLNSS